jgi:hypothetical protein
MSETLVDVSTAAKRLGMTRSSIYRLVKLGRVPSFCAGPLQTGIRIDIEEAREALRRPTHDAKSTGAVDRGLI